MYFCPAYQFAMIKLFQFILFVLISHIGFSQIVIPTKSGENFKKGYYHLPVKVIVKGGLKFDEAARNDFISEIKGFGFTDTVLLFTLPEYPTKKYKDSIEQICMNNKIGSVMEFSFSSYSSSSGNSLLFIEIKTSNSIIKLDYRAYDAELGKAILPNILFGASSIEAIKKLFIKAVPKTQ